MFFEPFEESKQTEKQDVPADPRVSSALDELDIPYRFHPATGRFEILCQLENGRSQTVFIYSRTDDFMGFELREISSATMVSDGPFDSRTTNLLMRVNTEHYPKFVNPGLFIGVKLICGWTEIKCLSRPPKTGRLT